MNQSDTKIAFSGSIDTRNAVHEIYDDDFNLTGEEHYPNVDMLYGPYDSLEEAFAKLSEKNAQGVDALVKGKTVGVNESGKIVEYWFENAPSTPATTTTTTYLNFSGLFPGETPTELCEAIPVEEGKTYTLSQLISGGSEVTVKVVKVTVDETERYALQLVTDKGTYYLVPGIWDYTDANEYSTTATTDNTVAVTTVTKTTGGEYIQADLVKKHTGKSYEVKGDLLIVTDENSDKYAANLIPYTAPTAPALTASWTKDLVSGASGEVVITNKDTHTCKIYYTTDGTAPSTSSSSVSLAAGSTKTIYLTVDTSKQSETRTVKAAAVLNGLGLDSVTSQDYTLRRKVSTPVITVPTNKYNTSGSITATCATSGATLTKSFNGGTYGTYSETPVTASQSAGYVKIKATLTGWIDSDEASSEAFTLGAKKFYIGMGAATLTDETSIKALSAGAEQDTMAGTYSVARTVGSYLWICGSGTLTSVTASGYGVPMQPVTTVAGYNCYRSSSAMAETGTDSFTVN